MESQNHPDSDNPQANQDRARISSTYQIPPSEKKQQPRSPGDLTSRLVSVFLWLSFGTVVGCIGQMAVTRRPPNIGASMAVGLTAALTCAYKDLEGTQVPRQLLTNPQRFFNRFESRLGEHSVQLAENTGGQERLETKLDSLSERVDTLTLAMVRPIPQELPSAAPAPLANALANASLNGSAQPRTSLGAGFH